MAEFPWRTTARTHVTVEGFNLTPNQAQPQLRHQQRDASVVWDESPLYRCFCPARDGRTPTGSTRCVVADVRLTSLTLAADTFSRRAVSRTPRPSSSAARIRSTWNGVVRGLPNRLPDDLARSSPASTRSRIIARSNSGTRPTCRTTSCRMASRCRAPAGAGRGRCRGIVARPANRSGLTGIAQPSTRAGRHP